MTDWFKVTVEEEIGNPFFGRPHVVILGAGASVAAFPDGDADGRSLPVMDNIVQTLGLESVLDSKAIDYKDKNFEELYSSLLEAENSRESAELLEAAVQSYFAALSMPPDPTLYDHLVLSLREKDLIATFNWDPFLYHACWRNHEKAKLPHVIYLHGNVRIGFCLKHSTKGLKDTECSKCGETFTPSRLLFPVREKNYTVDPFIRKEWESLKRDLEQAYMLTIFGYGAPATDVEAVNVMKQAWGTPQERNLEEVEIIDIKIGDELRATWGDFIHTHHYQTVSDFYDSWIAKHPRRTCEAMWNGLMEGRFVSDNRIPRELNFEDLWRWYQPLLEAEQAAKTGETY